MIAQVLQTVSLVILMALLVFNLTQRRHLEHGEQKRFASLGFSGIALLWYAAALVIIRFSLIEILFLVPAAVSALVTYRFRKSLFLFRLHCAGCGSLLRISATLYHDDNLCGECREPAEPAKSEETAAPRDVSEVAWEKWKPDQDAVTCYIVRGDEVLLIHKKTGLGAGKVNAPGGRIESGESAADAAVRECVEEVGLTPHSVEKRADLSFEFTDGFSLHCSAFFAYSHTGTPTESDEADPFWCGIEQIPFPQMWEDDAIWLPLALKGEYVEGRFIFDGDRMLSKEIRMVDSFD